MKTALAMILVLVASVAQAGKITCNKSTGCEVEGPIDASILQTLESQRRDDLLVWLNEGTNQDLKELAKLRWLTWVNLRAKGVTDIAPLAQLAQLRNLGITSFSVRSIAALAGLHELEVLSLHLSGVADLSPLRGMKKLRILNLNNLVTDLSPLQGLTSLKELTLFGAPVTDFAALPSLTALERLDVSGVPFDLGKVQSLKKLQKLDVSDCGIKSLRPLTALSDLRDLNLYGNAQLADVGPLAKLTKLEAVSLGRTAIKDVNALRASAGELRTLDVPKTVAAASLDALKKAAPRLEATIEE